MSLFQTLIYTLEAVPQINPFNLTLAPTENLNPRTNSSPIPRPNSMAEQTVRTRGSIATQHRVRTGNWTYVHFPVRSMAPSISSSNIPRNKPTRRIRVLRKNVITTLAPSRPVETTFVLTTPRQRYPFEWTKHALDLIPDSVEMPHEWPAPQEIGWTIPSLHGHMHIDFSNRNYRPINNASTHSEPITKRQRQCHEPKPRYPELASRFPKIELLSLDDNVFDFMNAASFPQITFGCFGNGSISQDGVSTDLMDFLHDTFIPDVGIEFSNKNPASLDVLHDIFVQDFALELFADNDA